MKKHFILLIGLLFISFKVYAQPTSCKQVVYFKGSVKAVSCFENISYPDNVFTEYCKTDFFLQTNDPGYSVTHEPVSKCDTQFVGLCTDPNFPSFGDMKPRKIGFSTYYYKNADIKGTEESCKFNKGKWVKGKQ